MEKIKAHLRKGTDDEKKKGKNVEKISIASI